MFATENEVLDTGILGIGTVDELRFLGKIIKITNINNECDGVLEHIKIEHTFIRDISYQDIEFVKSEEGDYPVYKGTMYFDDGWYHRDFSSEDRYSKKLGQLYKVNPVRIVCINEHVLLVQNQDEEGIYYRQIVRSIGGNLKKFYKITDKEPLSNRRDYDTGDLYVYEKITPEKQKKNRKG